LEVFIEKTPQARKIQIKKKKKGSKKNYYGLEFPMQSIIFYTMIKTLLSFSGFLLDPE